MRASVRQLQAAVGLCLLIDGPFKALIMSVVYFYYALVPGDCHTLAGEKGGQVSASGSRHQQEVTTDWGPKK